MITFSSRDIHRQAAPRSLTAGPDIGEISPRDARSR
jgi:hypothetical protein